MALRKAPLSHTPVGHEPVLLLMTKQSESVGHAELVSGGQTSLHSHPGGGSGPALKSGLESAITEGTTRAVVFATAFASAPDVVVSFADNSAEQSTCSAYSPTTTGFTIRVDKVGGGQSKDRDVSWIATEAGNP